MTLRRALIPTNMRGFSLIEIIITTALLSLLVGMGLFMSFEAYRGATRRSERDTIVAMLEKARSRAMANIDQFSWSVCYEEPDYVIARGGGCPTGGVERVEANAGVAAASMFSAPGKFPVVEFAQLTGTTSGATITVIQPGNDPEVIEMNHEGRINW